MATSTSSATGGADADAQRMLQNFLKNEAVFTSELNFIDAFRLQDEAADLQHAPTAICVDVSSSNSSADNFSKEHHGYFTTFAQEMDLIAKTDALVEQGQQLIHMLYTYRSVSQAIPEMAMSTPKDATVEEAAEIAAKRAEINRKVLDVLRPEIGKLKELMAYILHAVGVLHNCFTHLTAKEARKEQVPSEGIHSALVRLMDVLLILDNLKDIKACLKKDFSRYKRVVGAQPSIEVLEELNQLQTFLSNPDPRKAKNFVFISVRDEVKRVSGHESILLDALEIAVDALEREQYTTPEDMFRLLRVLPYFMLIADGDSDDPKSFNIFKTSKFKISAVQKVFKRLPVVPLYGDMAITLEFILHRSPHYEASSMGAAWGRDPDGRAQLQQQQQQQQQYAIGSYWESIRAAHSHYFARYFAEINRYRKYPFRKVLDEVTVEMSQKMFGLVVEGLQKLSQWSIVVKQLLSWKYTHPCSEQHLLEHRIDSAVEGIEYARVLRHNMTKTELSQLVDVVSMIKSLSAALLKHETIIAPYVRCHVHCRIQQLVQGDLTPLLHRLDKRNKPILPTLLKLRSLAADWLDGKESNKDYKEYTRKQGAVRVAHPARVVSASATQLFILRAQVGALIDSNSEVRRKQSMFAKPDLEKEDVLLLERFYSDSFYFAPALDFHRTLHEVSDLGDLWFREYFLEMTKCIQFPIEMSLPWILTEHLVLNHVSNSPMIENVLFLLDIYNDAAHRALYVLNQQFLYDEIEAEANLVVDQLYFLLSDEVYNYYKNVAATGLLERSLKQKLEVIKSSSSSNSGSNEVEHLTLPTRRLESLLCQRHIQLLGRSINFSFILGQNINNKFYRDIDFAIKRFESSDARGLPELKTFLDILRSTHSRLSQQLQLDDFDTMLSEVNESFSPSSFRGRISLHVLSSLAKDVIPNFSYNYYTRRFVSSPIAFRALMEYTKPPKQAKVAQAFGQVAAKAFEMSGRLTRGFFGRVHLEAYLSLGSSLCDLPMVIDQLLKNLYDKVNETNEYLNALKDGVPPCKPPKFMFQTVGGYGFYEGKLRSILSYDDLKPEVFQNFREIGNTMALLADLSETIELSDQFDFMALAPLLGAIPPHISAQLSNKHSASDTTVNGAVAEDEFSKAGAAAGPFVRVVQHTAAAISSSAATEAKAVRAKEVWSRLPQIANRLAETAFENKCSNGSRSLMNWVMLQIEDFLYQQNLTVEWSANSAAATAVAASEFSAIEVENAAGFHRLWSALSFLFCIADDNAATAAAEDGDTVGGDAAANDTLISNESEFGHGFTIAGVLFLHMLKQRPIFELLDFSTYVLSIHSHEQKTKDSSSTQQRQSASLDQQLLQETSSFVEAAKIQQQLQHEVFAFLESLHRTRDSYLKPLAAAAKHFHPPPDA